MANIPCSVTKEELIERLRNRAGLSKAQAAAALNALISEITEALECGQAVRLVDFGTFEPAFRKGRSVLNPQTKERMQVPAKRVPTFRAGKQLKQRVANV